MFRASNAQFSLRQSQPNFVQDLQERGLLGFLHRKKTSFVRLHEFVKIQARPPFHGIPDFIGE
jgi:hypothetical protein